MDPILIAAIASAATLLLNALYSNRMAAQTAATGVKKSELDALKDAFSLLQTTNAAELLRLNGVITTQDETLHQRRNQIADLTREMLEAQVSCMREITDNKAEYTMLIAEHKVQIAQLQEQLKVSPVFNGTAALPVTLVSTAIKLPVEVANPLPVPVIIESPLPLPMTQAEKVAAAAAVARGKEA